MVIQSLRVFFFLSVGAVASLRATTLSPEEESKHRGLLFFNADQYCDNIEIQPFGIEQFECSCKAKLMIPSATCVPLNREPLCPFFSANLLCGIPELRMGFSMKKVLDIFKGENPFSAEICYNEATVGGFALPGGLGNFCVDFANPGEPFSGPFSFLNGLLPSFSADSVSSDQAYALCSARVDGETCEVCEPCDDGKGGTGVRFSCKNGAIAANTCTSIATTKLPTNLFDKTEPLSFVAPSIDSL